MISLKDNYLVLKNKATKKRHYLKVPYVGFSAGKKEFLQKFILGDKEPTKFEIMDHVKKITISGGAKINIKAQELYNLKNYSATAKNLDELINLITVYKSEFKVPNLFMLINQEFEELEKILKKKESRGSTAWEGYTATKNFVYRSKLCVKSGGKTKIRKLLHLNKNSKSFNNLTYFYDRLNHLLLLLFDFEDNMFAIDKGVRLAVDGILESKQGIKIDIKDFFNSVTKKQILKSFKENCKYEISEPVIRQLIRIATPGGHPYQGMKLSTLMAYIALLPVIKELNVMDTNEKAVYIDDVFIKGTGDFDQDVVLLHKYKSVFRKHGFITNDEKSKVLYGNKVFFLGVNLQTKQLGYNSYIRKFKPEMWRFYDTFFLSAEHIKNPNRKTHASRVYFERKLEQAYKINGKANYIKHINEEQYNRLLEHPKYGKIMMLARETISKHAKAKRGN